MKHMESDGEMEKWEIARKRGETGFNGINKFGTEPPVGGGGGGGVVPLSTVYGSLNLSIIMNNTIDGK